MGDAYEDIIRTIKEEREHQDEKWGGKDVDRKHSTATWLAFLTEYNEGNTERTQVYPYGTRLIKMAALALAALEAFDLNCTGRFDQDRLIAEAMDFAQPEVPQDDGAVQANIRRGLAANWEFRYGMAYLFSYIVCYLLGKSPKPT